MNEKCISNKVTVRTSLRSRFITHFRHALLRPQNTGLNKSTTLCRASHASDWERVTLHMSQPNESRAVCRDFDKRKHYFSLHTSEQVVVHEIYGAQIAVNTVLIKCETDMLSDRTR